MPEIHHLDRRAERLAADGAGNGDDLLDTKQVADWLTVSVQWLEVGRTKGYGPQFTRVGPYRIRYLRSAVLAWLQSRQHLSTAEYEHNTPQPRGSKRRRKARKEARS